MARDARVFEKSMFYFTLMTLHLLAAVVWIGGMLFLGLVLTPVLRCRPPDERASLLSAVGRRFLKVGWAALGAILVTGPLLWIKRGFDVTPVLVVKLTLVGVILLLSVLHDFVLGPRLIKRLRGGVRERRRFGFGAGWRCSRASTSSAPLSFSSWDWPSAAACRTHHDRNDQSGGQRDAMRGGGGRQDLLDPLPLGGRLGARRSRRGSLSLLLTFPPILEGILDRGEGRHSRGEARRGDRQ